MRGRGITSSVPAVLALASSALVAAPRHAAAAEQARVNGSGSALDLMKPWKILGSLSPGMAEAQAAARKKPWAIVAVTDHESNERVAGTRSSVGTAALTSVIVSRLPLNVLSLDGVGGTIEALARGRYPLAQDLIFVTAAGSSPAGRSIVDFAFSPEGRAIAEKSGVLLGARAELAR